MATKDYGAGVSGYLDPEGRNWETTVYQAAKPILDKELNLIQDASQAHRLGPSGWLSSDYLTSSDMVGGIYLLSTTVNQLDIPSGLTARVNGWNCLVSHTLDTTNNILDLGASPTGAGTKRTDLVVLEVWRRLLSATPSTDGKSHTGLIWRNGNVKIASADDVALNYADDIEDAAVGSESTKRVQIQYRLRVIQDVDLSADPYGMTDTNVVANSVPASAAAPDGVATTWTYSNQSAGGDPGLWRAGDGSPANTLGTVDGYMYSIPLLAVARRNDTAFDRNTNHNGGVATPGPSDRPDGLFYDIIADQDVLDLRLGVAPSSWDYREVMERNLGWLFDNTLQNEQLLTTHGGGVLGHTVLWADEIGVLPGDSVTTGDTPGATFIRQFDAVARRFSDRNIIETFVVRYEPTDGSGGGPNWANGDTVTVDFTALKIYPYHATPLNYASRAPSTFSVVGASPDVSGNVAYFVGAVSGDVSAPMPVLIYGTGGVPQGSLTVVLDTIPAGVTDEPLYIRLVVSYPAGEGLSKTPVEDFAAASLSINNPAQLPATAPFYFNAVFGFDVEHPHREATISYETVTISEAFVHPTGVGTSTLFLRERAVSLTWLTINTVPYGGSISISPDGYEVQLAASSLSPGDAIVLDYEAVRPFPQNGEQVTVYYDTRAPQTVPDGLLPTPLKIIPRCVGDQLYSMVVGSGSPDDAYPYDQQYVQTGGVYPASGGTFAGDHELSSSGSISVEGLSLDTGMLRVPTNVPMVSNADETQFTRAGGDVDAEGRSFYKEVPTNYKPNAWGVVLSEAKRHKVLLPVLGELVEDSSFGFKGQMVLVTIQRWATLDIENSVYFDSVLASNTTSASVYKVRGNLLNTRSV